MVILKGLWFIVLLVNEYRITQDIGTIRSSAEMYLTKRNKPEKLIYVVLKGSLGLEV